MHVVLYDRIRTVVDVQSDFDERVLPRGSEGVVVECYTDPEGYAVDLEIPDDRLVGGLDFETVVLLPNQFEVLTQ